MSSKDRFVGTIYADDYPLHYDVQPQHREIAEDDEDSFVRILQSVIVHPTIDKLDERDQLNKDLDSLD